MELQDMLAVQPRDYLAQGFLDDAGQVREGINGASSLAMAYRCGAEGISPAVLLDAVDFVRQAADEDLEPDELDEDLDPGLLATMDSLAQAHDLVSAPAVQELFETALPGLRTGRDLDAFLTHLQRIADQLDLILKLGAEPEAPETD